MAMKRKRFFGILLSLAMMIGLLSAVSLTAYADFSPKVTLDFSGSTNWGIPTSYTCKEQTYTSDPYSIKLFGTGDKGYKMDNKFLIVGREGAYLELPAFDFPVERVVVTGNPGASDNVEFNLFAGENSVSTPVEGSRGTQIFDIAEGYQAAGNVYTLKVLNRYNVQITKIEIYEKTSPTSPYKEYLVTKSDDAASLANKVVHFNGLDWYIIDDNSEAIDNGAVTLFAKESVGKAAFNESGDDGNAYSNSKVKDEIDELTTYGGTFADAAEVIKRVDLEDVDVTDAGLYLLSTDEAKTLPLALREFDDYWWLRSKGARGKIYAACVRGDGTVKSEGSEMTYEDPIRPALQLDLSKVEFDPETRTFSFTAKYPLWVDGEQVTSDNKDDVLKGTSNEGKVRFTTATKETAAKLTLSGADIQTGYNYHEESTAGIYYMGENPLNIELSAGSENTIGNVYQGIDSLNKNSIITICGTGKLTAEGIYHSIFSLGTLKIEGGDITASVTNKEFTTIEATQIEISGGSVTTSSDNKGVTAISTHEIIITDGTVNVSGGDYGIYSYGNLVVTGGTVTATGLEANGINSNKNVIVTGGTVTASGLDFGIIATENVLVIGCEVEASAAAEDGNGVCTIDGKVMVGEDLTGFVSKGGGFAIAKYDEDEDVFTAGIVQNSIAGTGWTNVEGTTGEAAIAVNTDPGQKLDYKKVQFPEKGKKITVKPVLAAKGIAKGKTSLKLGWTKVNGAKKYEIWLSKCSASYKKVKTLSATKTSFTKKKLKKNTACKFYVVAKDAAGKTICKSKAGHAVTGNVRGKYTNAKSLKLSKTKVTLAKGKSVKIKATQKKAKKGKKLLKHTALLRYTSENTAVATVSKNGTIKGVGAGTCRIFVQTVNGIWKTVTVTVK